MTNDERSTNAQMTQHPERARRHSDFAIPSVVVIRHSSFSLGLIATSAQLGKLLEKIARVDRVAVDTEADSLHCYREKLCLLQISLPVREVVAGIGDDGPDWRGSTARRAHGSWPQVEYS